MKSKYSGGVDVEHWPQGTHADLDALKAASRSPNIKHLDMTKYYTKDIGG